MAIFKSGNPTLSQKIFERSYTAEQEGVMTVRGSINKFGFLLLMVFVGAGFTWYQYYSDQSQTLSTWILVSLIGAFGTAIAISFKPNWARFLAPAYALLEGMLLGAISAFFNDAFAAKYPNMVMQAVALTFSIAFIMFLLYNFRIIQPTNKFKSVMLASSLGILLLYLAYWILPVFGVNMSFMSFGDTSLLGFGINIFVLVIAALSFILDFELIEVGAASGAPKYMEWYCAFSLTVTLVWLYIQVLKLLSRVASSRN